jgi:hypothetical protein
MPNTSAHTIFRQSSFSVSGSSTNMMPITVPANEDMNKHHNGRAYGLDTSTLHVLIKFRLNKCRTVTAIADSICRPIKRPRYSSKFPDASM